jgi:DNA-3-methyladenine glycosylase
VVPLTQTREQAVALGPPLPRSFYARPPEQVAPDLLGKILVHKSGPRSLTAGRIVETEAYLGIYQGEPDRAAHAFRGLTPRTRVIFGPPGHAYVYLIYGMYECLNFVADHEGTAGCVLIRALEPVEGLAVMHKRRPTARRDSELASGPGKLTLAMGITRRHNGADLTRGPLTVHRAVATEALSVGISPRIGIRHCADWPLRFFVQGNPSVSRGPATR